MTYPQQPYYPPQAPQQPYYPPQAPPSYAPPQQPYYPPAPEQQYAPPPAPVPHGTIDDFYSQPVGSGKSLTFDKKPVGFTYQGIVSRSITAADIQPQTDMRDRRVVLKHPDGRVKYVMVVPLQMQPSAEFPDGRAAWYVKGADRSELEAAMERAGCKPGTPPEMGAIVTITYMGERPIPGLNAQKMKQVTYQRPSGQHPDPAAAAPGAPAPAPAQANGADPYAQPQFTVTGPNGEATYVPPQYVQQQPQQYAQPAPPQQWGENGNQLATPATLAQGAAAPYQQGPPAPPQFQQPQYAPPQAAFYPGPQAPPQPTAVPQAAPPQPTAVPQAAPPQPTAVPQAAPQLAPAPQAPAAPAMGQVPDLDSDQLALLARLTQQG